MSRTRGESAYAGAEWSRSAKRRSGGPTFRSPSNFTIAQRQASALEDGLIHYRAFGGQAEAYLSDPEGGSPVGQVILIHEVWGFTQFIKDSCERLSRQGFRVVAPILYWRDKGLFSAGALREGMKAVWHLSLEERYQRPELEAALKKGHASPEAASTLRVLYDKRFRSKLLRDLESLAAGLREQRPDLRMGALGFSLGGKLALQLAGGHASLAACVTYSAMPVLGPTLRRIRSPMLLFYGGEDRFMLRDLPTFVKEAAHGGTELELKIYPSAGHEFFDHTDRRQFRAAAAEDAWRRSTDFLRRRLSTRTAGTLARGWAETKTGRPRADPGV
jgi:carboxymethylenebutenolidase